MEDVILEGMIRTGNFLEEISYLSQRSRKLGILSRKQNDAKAMSELDKVLRKPDKDDPVKYDFALFGLGVSERF
ncbi:MAG: hypothetical protein A2Y71_15320 [Bacteroidetes bacterium RBG_13_42_15]|nr:MAG: hypothetical protein A2Y71_15320 [Bacteroidetes bacterium RBG_13_42_15]